MRIRLLVPVTNARGVFRRGQTVEWPNEDAQPLVDVGAAQAVKGKAKETEPGETPETTSTGDDQEGNA